MNMDCCDSIPPEACTTCVNPCYRISGYADGDIVAPDMLTPAAAAALGILEGCGHDHATAPTWDGRFLIEPGGGGLLFGLYICNWLGYCDGDARTQSTDLAAKIAGGVIGVIQLQRACNPSTLAVTKTLSINYYRDGSVGGFSPGTQTRLWEGTSSDPSADVIGTYTRTGGSSTLASLTI